MCHAMAAIIEFQSIDIKTDILWIFEILPISSALINQR
jgi:hypothetical protein